MKKIKLLSSKSRIKNYPYQLTEWFTNEEDLDCYIVAFIKYRDENYGRIAECKKGFAIFTKGERLQKEVVKNEIRAKSR